jgi:MHS family alpha-ketoglutarate permease-like MFS transporter
MSTDAATIPAQPGHYTFAEKRQRVFAIMAASSGNLVEWFDFYTYAFTALFFAPAFFPKGDQTAQLLNAAIIFGVGFLVRPIGGWVFGKIADRKGRRTSLVVSVLMMGGGSLLLACLPTYQQVGAWAPFLLLVARLIQGMSVGGEYGATATYMSEVALRGQRGFFSSFQYVTLIGGQLLASLVITAMQAFLTTEEIKAGWWRMPFVIGALVALIAMFLRRTLHETTTAEIRSSQEAGSFSEIWSKHRAAFLTVLGYTAGGSLIFYTFTTYMQKFLVNSAKLPVSTASTISTVTLFVYMCMQPVFGALSDRIGRRTSMMLFGGLGALGVVPIMTLVQRVHDPVGATLLILVALAIVSLYTSISGIVKAEMFPTEVRALGVGVAYGIANAAFGGSAESVALWLKQQGMESAFFWYVTAMMIVAFLVSLRLPKRPTYLHEDH